MLKTVSVIILSYNSSNTIYKAIDSVLSQTYESVELIISDDGSKDFDKEQICNYIEQNDRGNIQNYVVINSDDNVGTVRNLHRAFCYYTGHYHMIIGADDYLHSSNVLSSFINTFRMYHDKPLAICADAYMYDSNGKYVSNMMTPEARQVLVEGNSERLLNKLRHTCLLLTVSTCYKREFLDVVGFPSLDYVYLEDWPTFVKMAKLDIVPVYLSGVCATGHVQGGIANGEKKVRREQVCQLFDDRQTLFSKETIPYLDEMPKEERQRYEQRQKLEQTNRYLKTEYNFLSKKDKLKAFFCNEIARQKQSRSIKNKVYSVAKLISNDCKKALLLAILILISAIVFVLIEPLGSNLSRKIAIIFELLFIAAISVFFIKALIRIFIKFKRKNK